MKQEESPPPKITLRSLAEANLWSVQGCIGYSFKDLSLLSIALGQKVEDAPIEREKLIVNGRLAMGLEITALATVNREANGQG